MPTIATLGPQGTFSDIATAKFVKESTQTFEVKYYPSIKRAFKAVGPECPLGVLPIENLSEGFVQVVLDLMVTSEINILQEILLPIQFSCVSQAASLKEIETVFVQFVAKGQCSEFLESLSAVEIIATESNIESLDQIYKHPSKVAAIVPHHSIQGKEFSLLVENVNDYQNNQTRFLVLTSEVNGSPYLPDHHYKTSLIVMDDHDHPGLLESILSSFSKREINLTSIVSRPTRETFGKYHFFIDIDGHLEEKTVRDALEEISKINKVKVLGSYLKARDTLAL